MRELALCYLNGSVTDHIDRHVRPVLFEDVCTYITASLVA